MNYDLLTKKENSMVAENIYGVRKMNTTNNKNNSKNSKQQSSKKKSKGIEVKPSDNVEREVHENSIQDIPIGYPVDAEKFKDLKKKIKKEDQNMDNEKVSMQEDEN
jgi:anti-sigma28 factor (negative regulator of flagellin synthesis)